MAAAVAGVKHAGRLSAMRTLVALAVGCGIAGCAADETELHDVAAILRRLAVLEAEVVALKSSATGSGAGRHAAPPPTAPLGHRECFNDHGTDCAVVPPLDAPVVWSKQHDEDGQHGTHSILALIQNETANESFPWPLYVQLTTSHHQGDAVGAYVRMNKTGHVDGPGGMKDPWQAAFHTDLGNSKDATGCSIGANIEITNPSPDVEAIGVNCHMVDGHGYAAVLTQSGPWDYGLLLQAGSHGGTGVKVDGNWSHAGIHIENNDLRLGAGARIVFESSAEEGGDEFALAFNPESRQLELSSPPTGELLWSSGGGISGSSGRSGGGGAGQDGNQP